MTTIPASNAAGVNRAGGAFLRRGEVAADIEIAAAERQCMYDCKQTTVHTIVMDIRSVTEGRPTAAIPFGDVAGVGAGSRVGISESEAAADIEISVAVDRESVDFGNVVRTATKINRSMNPVVIDVRSVAQGRPTRAVPAGNT